MKRSLAVSTAAVPCPPAQVGNAAARAVPAQQARERESTPRGLSLLPTTCASIWSSASGVSLYYLPISYTTPDTASSLLSARSPLRPPLFPVAPRGIVSWSDDDALSRQATPNLPLQRYTRGLNTVHAAVRQADRPRLFCRRLPVPYDHTTHPPIFILIPPVTAHDGPHGQP